MNLIKRINSYFSFSKKEILNMSLMALAAAFMLSFKEWGIGDVFDAATGLKNLFNTFLITASAMFVHESMHKIAALSRGYVSEHKPWWGAIFFGVLLAFISQGNLFFFGFGVVVYHMAGERLGTFRYGFNMDDVGFISMAGAVGNIVLMILFKMVFLLNGSPLAEKAMLVNIWFAVFSMLPLPWVSGGNLLFSGRTRYIFFITFLGALSIILYMSSSIIVALVASLVAAIVLSIFWSLFAEKLLD